MLWRQLKDKILWNEESTKFSFLCRHQDVHQCLMPSTTIKSSIVPEIEPFSVSRSKIGHQLTIACHNNQVTAQRRRRRVGLQPIKTPLPLSTIRSRKRRKRFWNRLFCTVVVGVMTSWNGARNTANTSHERNWEVATCVGKRESNMRTIPFVRNAQLPIGHGR